MNTGSETFSLQEFSTNAYLIKLFDSSFDHANQVASEFMKLDGIAGIIQNTIMINQINIIVKSLNKIMWVLILVAVLLGVVILYNLTNINVSERIRELSTIKVLGFFDKEVTLYIYRETIIFDADWNSNWFPDWRLALQVYHYSCSAG